MNRLLLQLAASKDMLQPNTSRGSAVQKLLMDETQRLLIKFLEVERSSTNKTQDILVMERLTYLVKELLLGYQNMDVEHLSNMQWLNPVLLGSCIQCRNEEIRLMVQRLVQRITPGSTSPYPPPMKEATTDPQQDVKAPEPSTDEAQAAVDEQKPDEGKTNEDV